MAIKLILLGVLILFFPVITNAQVNITEIMYNLEGNDSGREWIEVYNGGESDVEISGWRLFEGGTNHKLNSVDGDGILKNGEYAIIADDADKFLLDQPGFNWNIFDSSFSLKNTGELLELRDEELVPVDSLSYLGEWGASGDGNSLQKIGGKWYAALPTPGVANITAAQRPTQDDGNNTVSDAVEASTDTSGVGGGALVAEVEKSKIVAYIEGPETAVAGAGSEFRGGVFGLKEEPAGRVRFIWSFGDGGTKEGRSVFHTFKYPGNYMVVLSAALGELSAGARKKVEAVQSGLTITNVAFGAGGFIGIKNTGSRELDISFWKLRLGTHDFTIPKNTIILPLSVLKFSNEITGFADLNEKKLAFLIYPNGAVAAEYGQDKENVEKIVESQQNLPQLDASAAASRHGYIQETSAVVTQKDIKRAGIIERADKWQSITEAGTAIVLGEATGTVQAAGARVAVHNAFGGGSVASIVLWLSAVAGIILLGVAGFIGTRFGSEKDESSFELNGGKANEYEIIE